MLLEYCGTQPLHSRQCSSKILHCIQYSFVTSTTKIYTKNETLQFGVESLLLSDCFVDNPDQRHVLRWNVADR